MPNAAPVGSCDCSVSIALQWTDGDNPILGYTLLQEK